MLKRYCLKRKKEHINVSMDCLSGETLGKAFPSWLVEDIGLLSQLLRALVKLLLRPLLTKVCIVDMLETEHLNLRHIFV